MRSKISSIHRAPCVDPAVSSAGIAKVQEEMEIMAGPTRETMVTGVEIEELLDEARQQ